MRNKGYGGDIIHNPLAIFPLFWKILGLQRRKQDFFQMNFKNGIVSEKNINFYYIFGRGCPTSKSNYD